MGFKGMFRWLILVVMPLLLLGGCGDLEPDMQDTRTVSLNMDFHGKSSSRNSSSVSASELSQYNTHLILALPSWEYLTSNYRNYYSSFAQGLMNTADKKVSLEIPLNTQMKIFGFLFKETYSLSDLISGFKEVGYYGESQPFSIDEQTNNLSLGISLQSTDTTTGDGDGTDPDTGTETGDTTTPIIEQVTAIESPTSDSTPEYTFASTKAGSITYAGACYSSIIIADIGNNTIVFNALSDGYYYDCTVTVMDSEGNESNTLTIPPFTVDTTVSDITAPTVSSISGNTTEAGGTATFTVKLSSQPTANVTIGVSSSDTSEGTVSPSLLTFTSANWNVNQTVTVTGVNDSLNDGNQSYTVVLASANSSDSSYSGLNTNDVSVTNTDMTLTAVTIVLYETTTPTRDINNNIVYSDNNSASYSDSDLQADGVRIGYRMELTDNGTDYYAETFFDAWDGITLSSLLFPTVSNANVIQDNVTNMSVDSNYPTVTNTSSTTGRLEIWPWNYGAAAQNNIGGDNSKYDFDDTHTGSSSYGSMQVHNLSAAQTVMAWNRHYDSDPDIGFGNNPANTGNNKHPDWTFSSDSSLGTSNWKFQVLFRYYY
jgi:hypothetical protein